MIGSTANIVALGMLEKRYRIQIYFLQWLKVGAVVGLISCLVAWAGIAVLSPYMPTKAERMSTISSSHTKTHPENNEYRDGMKVHEIQDVPVSASDSTQ